MMKIGIVLARGFLFAATVACGADSHLRIVKSDAECLSAFLRAIAAH